MVFEKTKKNILKIKLILSIILNFLKLRDLQFSKDSTNISDKLYSIENINNILYDILNFNIFSISLNSVDYYKKIKKGCKFLSCSESV
jgi:hypothetical protein